MTTLIKGLNGYQRFQKTHSFCLSLDQNVHKKFLFNVSQGYPIITENKWFVSVKISQNELFKCDLYTSRILCTTCILSLNPAKTRFVGNGISASNL